MDSKRVRERVVFSLPLAVTQGWIEVSEGIMFSAVQLVSVTADNLIKD